MCIHTPVCLAVLCNVPSSSEQPGLLKKVQGIGWYLEEANLAQVSTNILDFEQTPLHTVYEEICREAEVRSSENRSGPSSGSL